MLYGRRNILIKKCVLFSLWIAAIIIKIKAETITKITEIATEMTETLAVIEYIDNLIAIVDLKDVAMSARKRIVVYRDI